MAESRPTFMVTTPIYYINAPLHLGHAYCTIACDALARFHRLKGEEVFFLTGLDEHGANIEKIAKEQGTTPEKWADDMAQKDRDFWRDLGITNDDLIRTTEKRHEKSVQELWKRIAAGKAPDGGPNLTLGEYEGWYCRPCETYYLEGDLADGNCPIHGTPAEKLKEETYFFRLSAYQEWFEKEVMSNREFVVPDTRYNEVAGFVREGLRDVSVSRSNIGWGIPVPGNPKHVVYVWFDALINYITAAGFPDDMARFGRLWPAVHVIGKEILRFHAVLWPVMLKAAGLPLPRKIVAHGWWTVEGEKMSKSKGNVIDPREYAKEFSLDAVRYCLLREMPFGADGDFARKRFIERYNADLANVFGNLAHRTISMAFRYLNGVVKRPVAGSPWEESFRGRWPKDAHPELDAEIKERCSRGLTFIQSACMASGGQPLKVPQFQDSLVNLLEIIAFGNKYIDTEAPWNKTKEEQERVLGAVLELLEAASWPLLAFIPDAALKLRKQLGLVDSLPPGQVKRAPLPEAFNLAQGDPLFPRIDTKKK